ncbi:MAG: FGGY-family carbohydrate kinase [Pseudorhizobium sp.]
MRGSFERIAVIDIGKTNAKLVIVDAETGAEIAARTTANTVLPGPPYPHFDTERLWAFILDTLARFAVKPGFDALSVTTHGASAALLDEKDALALPVLDYEHVYPDQVNQAYDAVRPDFSESFSPRLPGGLNLGAQLHYLRYSFREEFNRVATILTYPQYWAHRLTGIAANEKTSLGCHTDLWMPYRGGYSALVHRLEIAEKMAPIRSAFDTLGNVTPELSRQLGLPRSVPVYCGIHDSNASLLPHLVSFGHPCTAVSTGTWVVCFSPGGQPDKLDRARDTLVNVDAYGNPVPSARYMGGREWEMITKDLPMVTADAEWAAVEAVVTQQQMFLPSMATGTGPFPGIRGRWYGDPKTNAGRRAAASLYQALMTMTCLDMIGSRGPIIVEGPLAANVVYLSAINSLSKRAVYASQSITGTSAGASLLAGGRSGFPVHLVQEKGLDLDSYRRRWETLASG